MNYWQQGDVLLKPNPLKGKPVKQDFLYKATPTANPHYCAGGKFKYLLDGQDIFLKVDKATKLKHPEHYDILLPEGEYKVEIVQEYDHWKEESRRVVD